MSKKLSPSDYQFLRVTKGKTDAQAIPKIAHASHKLKGSAKSGKYTAIVEQGHQTSMIKNGQSIHASNMKDYAEIFAEVISSMLLAKFSPNSNVRCQAVIGPDRQELYVQSFFPQSPAEPGHKIGGHDGRGKGAGMRRLLATVAGKDSMIKRLKIFNSKHRHTLEIGVATNLLLGNDDVHSENFGFVEEGSSGHFVFFDYGKNGRQLSSQMRLPGHQMGLQNFFIAEPTYHDWDFGKKFFESPHYLKAIHDILNSNDNHKNSIKSAITDAIDDIFRQIAFIEKANNLEPHSEQKKALQAYAKFLGFPGKLRKEYSAKTCKIIIVEYYTRKMESRIQSLKDIHDTLLLPTLSRILKSKQPLAREEIDILRICLQDYVENQRSKHKATKIDGILRSDLLNVINDAKENLATVKNTRQIYATLGKAHDFIKFINANGKASHANIIVSASKKSWQKASKGALEIPKSAHKLSEKARNILTHHKASLFFKVIKKINYQIAKKNTATISYSSHDNPTHSIKVSAN